MMSQYKLKASPKFKREYKKLARKSKRVIAKIDSVAQSISENPFAQSLRTHSVGNSRNYGTIYSSRVTGDLRILWVFDKSQKKIILLLNVGGHDDVY